MKAGIITIFLLSVVILAVIGLFPKTREESVKPDLTSSTRPVLRPDNSERKDDGNGIADNHRLPREGDFSSSVRQALVSAGVGENRNRAIRLLFAKSTCSIPECMAILREFGRDEEKKAAMMGLAFRFGKNCDFSQISEFIRSNPDISTQEASIFANALTLMLNPEKINNFLGMEGFVEAGKAHDISLPESLELLDLIETIDTNGPLKLNRKEAFLKAAYHERPFETFKILSDGFISGSEKPGELENLRRFCLSYMFSSNSKRALDLVLAGNQSTVSGGDFGFAFQSWVGSDRREAINWFNREENRISPEFRAAAQSAFVVAASEAGDFRLAREWLERVENPDERKNLEQTIWSNELVTVRTKTQQNPEQFLNKLTGSSEFPDYWIKDGFKTWFSANSDKANAWFSQNQTRLTPSQSQHVARAYAEVALGEGDINLARQWAEQVIDPNFKQKLVEQIDAAAGETE